MDLEADPHPPWPVPRAPLAPSRPSGAPGQRGAFVRRQHSAWETAAGARPAEAGAAGDPVAWLKHRTAQALSGLSSMRHELYVLLAQPEADSETLRRMGFLGLSSCDAFLREFKQSPDDSPRDEDDPRQASTVDVSARDNILQAAEGNLDGLSRARAVLVLSVCTSIQAALMSMRALDERGGLIGLAVLLCTDEDPQRELELSATFYEDGASDVICLREGLSLSAWTVKMSTIRTECLWRRAAAAGMLKLETETRKLRRSLKGIGQTNLWEVPGNALESTPFENEGLHEDIRVSGSVGDYALREFLGSGSFAAVFKADHPQHGLRAVKVTAKSSVKTIRQLLSINSEICILMSLPPHPNLVGACQALHTRESIIIVMDYVGDLNLSSFIASTVKGSEPKILPLPFVESFSRQAARGLAHMHGFRVCHRDLKPTNFLVTNDGSRLKLADLGLACQCIGPCHLHRRWCGSLPFVAPELLHLRITWPSGDKTRRAPGYCGLAADIWSLGVNFLELGHGRYAMDKLLGWKPKPPSDPAQLQHDLSLLPALLRSGPEMPLRCLQSITEQTFQLDPKKRCSIQWILGAEGFNANDPGSCPFHGLPLIPPR